MPLSLSVPRSQPLSQTGQYYLIKVMADEFAGEVLNVGVSVIAQDGTRHVKCISEAGRLECLYGENGAKVVVALASLAKSAAELGEQSPTPSIIFTDPMPLYNSKAEDALKMIFRDAVTVAIPQRASKTDEGSADWKTDAVIIKIYDWLRLNDVDGLANSIIPSSPETIVETSRGLRKVRIPLQPKNGAGAVRSAAYSAQTVKSHLMDAVLDIECAAEHRSLKSTGLFIVRPTDSVPKDELYKMDKLIDSVAFRVPKNMAVEVEPTAESLAEKIQDWALRAEAA